jgi:hypothetical protein
MGKDCQCTGRSRNCSCGAKGKKTESNATITNDTKQKSKNFITTLPKEVAQEYTQLLTEKSTNKLEEKKTGSLPKSSGSPAKRTERPKFVIPASSKNKVDNEMKKKAESYLMKTELKPKSRLAMISYETNPRQSKRIDMIKTEDKRDVRVPVDYYKKKAKK